MRLAVISDVHGNLEALRQVLDDIDQVQVDEIICLGDNVGYYPEADAVIETLHAREIKSLMGNHELGLTNESYLDWFNAVARQALLFTKQTISPDGLAYCQALPHNLKIGNHLFVHGCPPDSPLIYIFELPSEELRQIFQNMTEEICFLGHTHMLGLFSYDGRNLQQDLLGRTVTYLETGRKYIINVGSVGQPRDLFSREAKYVVWDASTRVLEVRFVPYDASITAARIRRDGWPETLAKRLF